MSGPIVRKPNDPDELKLFLNAKRFTQRHIAEMTGVPQVAISRYTRGLRICESNVAKLNKFMRLIKSIYPKE